MKMSKKSKIVIYILLGLVAIYFLAPFIYMLFSAFKTEGEAIAYPPKLLPQNGILRTLLMHGNHSRLEHIFGIQFL